MKQSFTFLLLLTFFTLNAQENLDNFWIFGQFSASDLPISQGSIVDFGEDSIETFEHSVTFEMDFSNTSMCNETGNLLFYTNGRYVGDVEHNIMENGDSLNLEYMLGSSEYLILTQGVISVPMPDNPGKYYLFHLGVDTFHPDGELNVASFPLFYSVIDFTDTNRPLGYVSEKNTVVSTDTMNLGKLSMTRHANGRDWWLICSQWNINKYNRFLISPEGITELQVQEVGIMTHRGRGQVAFSPDGSMYASVALKSGLEAYLDLYDFDRCTGELSNHRQYLNTEGTSAVGVSFSPNSRYLYFNTRNNIYQYDTHAEDIWSSEQHVAEYDGFEEEVYNDISGSTSFIPTPFFFTTTRSR